MLYQIFILATVINFVNSAELPASIIKCKKSDKGFNNCLVNGIKAGLNEFADGYKSLLIPKLEPLFIEKLDIDLSNIHYHYDNANIHGMTSSDIFNMEANFQGDNCFWKFEQKSSVLRMEADYTINGKLLIFTINSKGTSNTTLTNFHSKHEMKCERIQIEGKTHLNIVDYKIVMEADTVHFNYIRTIPGDQQLAKQILQTINENSVDVFKEMKPEFENTFGIVYKTVINGVFKKVSENELFLE